MKILLVEDDKNLATVLTNFLKKHDYLVDVCADGELAWDMVNFFTYDMILLDVMLPNLSGIDICRRLREKDRGVPIMMITARDSVADKLSGLDVGADNYLVKPFDLKELLSRIRVLFRRFAERPLKILTLGNIRFDPEQRSICRDGVTVSFTRKEFLLLELLFHHPRRIFSRGDIVDRLWPMDNPPTEDTVKSHIRRIRTKLSRIGAEALIETLYGHGYRIDPVFLEKIAPEPLNPESPLEKLNNSLLDIWETIRPGVFEQVDILENTIGESERRRTGLQAAHKLAGTAGSCGFEAASHIAKAIEIILETSPVERDTEDDISLLVRVLRRQLEGRPVLLENSDRSIFPA